jgi:hypothetical protein
MYDVEGSDNIQIPNDSSQCFMMADLLYHSYVEYYPLSEIYLIYTVFQELALHVSGDFLVLYF